jgi:methionyl-tRNA formyltransferase
MEDTLKIGYFADGPWAHGALELLFNDSDLEVVFICARYSRPDQRLRAMASEAKVDFLIEKDVNAESFVNSLRGYGADLFVSMSFDQILRRPLYSMPRLGTINCHAGKLPFYRGRNVLNWVLINDEKEFGITVHYVDDGVDTGDIIIQSLHPISDADNYGTLLRKAFSECPIILNRAIQSIRQGTVKRIAQSSMATAGLICSQRMPGDERINWCATSREIFNFIRALSEPGPRAITYADTFSVRINKADLIPCAPIYIGIPGAILAKEGNGFLVKTGDSYIKITEWSSTARLKAGARFL